jgi:hypothetical protein
VPGAWGRCHRPGVHGAEGLSGCPAPSNLAFVRTLARGTALLSFGGASRGSLFCDGVVAEDVLFGPAMGISSVITRPRGVSIGSYPCFVPVGGRSWLLARAWIWSARPRAFACLLRSGFGRRLLFIPRCLLYAWSRVGLGGAVLDQR